MCRLSNIEHLGYRADRKTHRIGRNACKCARMFTRDRWSRSHHGCGVHPLPTPFSVPVATSLSSFATKRIDVSQCRFSEICVPVDLTDQPFRERPLRRRQCWDNVLDDLVPDSPCGHPSASWTARTSVSVCSSTPPKSPPPIWSTSELVSLSDPQLSAQSLLI